MVKAIKNKFVPAAMALGLCFGAVAVWTSGASYGSTSKSVTVVDGTGATITVTGPVTRVVALDGSAAVSFKELGLSPQNIAYGSSNKLLIDQVFGSAAKKMTATGGSWDTPNVEDIIAFHPSLVVADMGEGGIQDGLKGVAPLYMLSVGGYRQVLEDFLNFGKLTGRVATAQRLVSAFNTTMSADQKIAAKSSTKPTTLIVWGSSLTNFQVPGTSDPAASLLDVYGKYAMPEEDGWSSVSMQSILAANPDVIFVETLSRASHPSAPSLSSQLAKNPVWRQLKAVKDHHVYEVNPLLWNYEEGNPGGLQQILTQAVAKLYPAK
jgi:iron complex transport system substrate-binding protein